MLPTPARAVTALAVPALIALAVLVAAAAAASGASAPLPRHAAPYGTGWRLSALPATAGAADTTAVAIPRAIGAANATAFVRRVHELCDADASVAGARETVRGGPLLRRPQPQ